MNIVLAAFLPDYAVLLASTPDFVVWRRGKWLGIRDKAEGRSLVVRLELHTYSNKQGAHVQRYRVRGKALAQMSSLFLHLEREGIFIGCKSAFSGGGYLYLNRVIAAIAQLTHRDGLDSLRFLKKGSRKLNRAVHHINGDTLDDRAANLRVMAEIDHDNWHSVLTIRAACFLPVAPKPPCRGLEKPTQPAPCTRTAHLPARNELPRRDRDPSCMGAPAPTIETCPKGSDAKPLPSVAPQGRINRPSPRRARKLSVRAPRYPVPMRVFGPPALARPSGRSRKSVLASRGPPAGASYGWRSSTAVECPQVKAP